MKQGPVLQIIIIMFQIIITKHDALTIYYLHLTENASLRRNLIMNSVEFCIRIGSNFRALDFNFMYTFQKYG